MRGTCRGDLKRDVTLLAHRRACRDVRFQMFVEFHELPGPPALFVQHPCVDARHSNARVRAGRQYREIIEMAQREIRITKSAQ